MAGDELALTLGFEADTTDLENVVRDTVRGLEQEIGDTAVSLTSLQSTLRDMVQPMRELRDLAKEIKTSFEGAQASAKSIRESIASTRLQAGLGAAGGTGAASAAGGGGGIGALGNMLGGMGGIGARGLMAGGAFTLAGATGLGAAAFHGLSGIQTTFQNIGAVFSALESGRNPFTAVGQAQAARRYGIERTMQRGGFFAPIQAYAQGASMGEVAEYAQPGQLGGAYGMMRGFMGSVGQGPVGMMANIVGGAFGGAGGERVGSQIGEQLGIGTTAGGMMGAEVGRQLVTGAVQRYIQEGMQRYQGYISTMSGIAAPRQYGMTREQFGDIRGMASRFGYGPGEIGGQFGAMFQGFGGGQLTTDTLRTAMAYSRAQGVGMGAIGQAIGGLTMQGGAATMDAQSRENVMVRVMADAVAAGFGRRLPEFASAVGSGVSVAMSGPGMIRNADMANLIESVSTVTANVARTRGVGLQAAGRFVAPIAGAAGGMLRGLLGGGGDPVAMGMLLHTQRERFGGDLFEMAFGQGGLLEAQADPFGRGMELLAPMMRQTLRQSSTRMGAAMSIQGIFQGLGQEATPEMIRDIVQRGGGALQRARAEGRDLTDEEMLTILHDIVGTQEEGSQSVQETMRDIQQSGEDIMREQLGEMRRAAGFAWSQLGISGAMARDAAGFHRAQMAETRRMADMIRTSAISETLSTINRIRERGAATGAEQGVVGYAEFMVTELFGVLQGMGRGTGFFRRGGPQDAGPAAAAAAMAESLREDPRFSRAIEAAERRSGVAGTTAVQEAITQSRGAPGATDAGTREQLVAAFRQAGYTQQQAETAAEQSISGGAVVAPRLGGVPQPRHSGQDAGNDAATRVRAR